MDQKAFPLSNRGMNRDISISKASNEFAFDNHNIRIIARDHDTFLSVTNERGNKMLDLTFSGDLIGWNTLNDYLILFTVDSTNSYIYRVKYTGVEFKKVVLFSGDLGFDRNFPIESVVDYETEDIQKIYWIDGKNVLRFLNFSDTYLTKHLISGTLDNNPVFSFHNDSTWFDSTRPASTAPKVVITKDNGGNSRPNGVAQYFLTYYNKNAQQTGIIWASPLVYLSPEGRGGTVDGSNTNKIELSFSGLDTSFEYARLYQVFRSSLNGQSVGYLIGEAPASSGSALIVDDGAHKELVDAMSFLFLGSQELKAGTLAHKDGTLFLGDLRSVGNAGIEELEAAVKNYAFIIDGETFEPGVDWESAIVYFVQSDTNDLSKETNNIQNVAADGYYPYENQLKYSNDKITTFKGGEKYRFALQFFRSNGTFSKPFWIGDKVNPYYPKMRKSGETQRAIAICTIPTEIITAADNAGFQSVQLMIAEATYSDRSVLAQGIVSPTVFNLYHRYSDSPYTQPSWNYRTRGGLLPSTHFSTLLKSNSNNAELQTSWWGDSDSVPTPLYYTDSTTGKLSNKPYGYQEYSWINVKVVIHANIIVTDYWGYMSVKYYDSATGGTPKEKYKILGTRSGLYHKSLLQILDDWQKAYDELGVPMLNRASTARMREVCATALDRATISDCGDETYELVSGYDSGTRTSFDFRTLDIRQLYSRLNREYFFVDENVVTLNSPEIEYEQVDVDQNSGLKFRIVGAAKMTSSIADYNIEANDYKYAGDRVLRQNFSKENISNGNAGLSAWPLYLEYGIYKDTQEDKYKHLDVPYAYMTYLWHKSGSIPMYSEDDVEWSVLSKKRFANLHYAYYSVFNDYQDNTWEVVPDDLRQFVDVSQQLYNLKIGRDTRVYSGNIDDLIVMPDELKYPVFFSKEATTPDSMLSIESVIESADPVRITYNSRPHAVISLPSVDTSVLLPYLFDSEKFTKPGEHTGSVGPIIPWRKLSYVGENLMYREVDVHDATDLDDLPSGGGTFQDFTLLEVNDDYDTVCLRTSDEYTIQQLASIKEESDKKAGDKLVSVFARDTGYRWWMADIRSFSAEYLKISGNLEKSYMRLHIGISSSIPMDTIYLIVSGMKPDYTEEILFDGTVSVRDAGLEGGVTVLGADSNRYRNFFVGYRVDYAPTYNEEQGGQVVTSPIVPALDRLYGDNCLSVGYPNYSSNREHSRYGIFNHANFIDPSANEEDITFVDIGVVPDSRIKLTSDHHFVYVSEYTNDSFVVSQSQYQLPDGNHLIQNGDEYLFIGELYKDYDSDPTTDTRYGGISEAAVESNRFISAGRRVLLSEREEEVIHQLAVFDCADLYRDASAVQPSLRTIYFSVGIDGEESEEFHLSTIESMSQSSMTLQRVVEVVMTDINTNSELVEATDLGDGMISIASKVDSSEVTLTTVTIEGDIAGGYDRWVYEEFSAETVTSELNVVGNKGDTYFQRWDSMKTYPHGGDDTNQVIDIASVMLESHINLDGRTDLDRGVSRLADIDYANFGSLNRVYSQTDNFFSNTDTDESFNLDTYRSSIVWTLQKKIGAEVDEWSHITLASSLALDGDKGVVQAIRRFKNSLLAFQDRGISEILFNSTQQIATVDGTPVELANSGKVDGKRYITNVNGCTNKWSITEGRLGLYFVDNINKIFAAIGTDGRGAYGVENLSAKSGFNIWFKEHNNIDSWKPTAEFKNFVSFYDRIHSDVYLVGGSGDEPCIVYNEALGTFSSFFDYANVPMMTNLGDKFISFKSGKLWLQNEGFYGNFFGENKPFWVTWRVSPNDSVDNIWTNVEYRSDFISVLDNTGKSNVDEAGYIGGQNAEYDKDMTFNTISVWDEYQKTGEVSISSLAEDTYPDARKKFRTWRVDIPRAEADAQNPYGLDRIRNPWAFIKLKKTAGDFQTKIMQLHNVVVKYFGE